MKARILETLHNLRKYALGKGCDISLFYHEEDSYLMRFANSAISLNTNEHLIRLEVTAYQGKQRASYELITNLDRMDEMKAAIDTAVEMVKHAQALSYTPSVPNFKESFQDESNFDPHLASLSNAARLEYFNQTVAGLEDEQTRLSGIFSNGANTFAQISTRSEHTQYFKTSDAQTTVVLSHLGLKWEVNAEQSAQTLQDLDARELHHDLTFLVERYRRETPLQIPTGRYDIVFGPAAIAELANFIKYIGYNGGLMKRGYSFLSPEQIGQQVFSPLFSLTDDPQRRETFPMRRDFMGIPRRRFPLVVDGVFKAFTWEQDDADEFSQTPSGHTVYSQSLVINGGQHPARNLEELAAQPRDGDLLYIPFLHYVNIVNPSKALVTGSSRFGALLLKADGSIVVPYNVRLTQSLLDAFGDGVAWMSQRTRPYNISQSYGARNPMAIITPQFMRVNGLEISHSNTSY